MTFAETQLLQRWARLQLAISIARTAREGNKLEHGVGRIDRVDSDSLTQSKGYRALRGWYLSRSPGSQRNFRAWAARQLRGVEQLKRKMEDEGGVFDYADLEFNVRNAENGELIYDDDTQPETATETKEQDNDGTERTWNEHRIADRYAQAAQARRPADKAAGGDEDQQDPRKAQP